MHRGLRIPLILAASLNGFHSDALAESRGALMLGLSLLLKGAAA